MRKKIKKVIFLDFDGVIRIPLEHSLAPDLIEFCQQKMTWVGHICANTRAEIVISSDWRNFESKEEIESLIAPIAHRLHEDWMTPILGHRHEEIQSWLDSHPDVERYVILDDLEMHFDGCSEEMRKNLILTKTNHGVSIKDILRATRILNTSKG